jgi:hypothetical protein
VVPILPRLLSVSSSDELLRGGPMFKMRDTDYQRLVLFENP